jgi:glycosyltransferase involved in cell wall biosynthesis
VNYEEIKKLFHETIPVNIPDKILPLRALSYLFPKNEILSKLTYLKYNEEMVAHLKNIIKKYNINLIHSHYFQMNLYIADIYEIPVVIDLADSHTLFFKRELLQSSSILQTIRGFFGFISMKRMENFILNEFNVITVVSPIDSNYLSGINSNSDIRVIPNGVDSTIFSKPKNVIEDFPSIVFSGNMRFPPNIDTAIYIYHKIYPLIQKRYPNAKFYIVGRDPSTDIMKLHNGKSVIVTGFVENISYHISIGSVYLSPMRKGSGLKNKILEAMSLEKPVVTNMMGVEAFNSRVRSNLLIGDNDVEIAEKVISLLDDRDFREENGKKNRNIVLNDYSWTSVAEKYDQLYYELVDREQYESQ